MDVSVSQLAVMIFSSSSSPIEVGSVVERNKPKLISIDQFTKIINSNLDELEDVIKQPSGQSLNATKISDIVARHLGFDKSPRKNNSCRAG